MDTLRLLIDWFLNQWDLRIILALIILDLVCAIGVAVQTKNFEWRRTTDFLESNVLPYLFVYGAMDLVLWLTGGWLENIKYVVFALILAKLTASIVGNLKTLGIETELPPTPSKPS